MSPLLNRSSAHRGAARLRVAAVSLGLLWATFASAPAAAARKVPARQIPASVLVELQQLDNQFALALSMDCDSERCFSKGCTYTAHAVSDQPQASSLPGLNPEAGPGSVAPQAYLTRARCSYAHEAALESSDVQALNRRLQAKLTQGWTVVTVDNAALQPLPAYMRDAPETEVEVEPEPEPALVPLIPTAPAWTAAVAGRELWTTLLPHFFWMIGVGLATLAGAALIWSWRRVGKPSMEDEALFAQLALPDTTEAEVSEDADDGAGSPDDHDFVAEQDALWRERLDQVDADHPDLELQALIRALLRSGEIPLLAKAVLHFPDGFPAAFPSGGDIATAKLTLADYLKTVDVDSLPTDAAFFAALNRHALAAALTTQSDAEVIRSLREDFGAAGLADLIGSLPPRVGALLFALAPSASRHEMVRLLAVPHIAEMAGQLLRSNRMDQRETGYLFDVLRSARGDAPPPPPLSTGDVSDRGATIDAAGALSVLLPRLDAAQSQTLFAASIQRFHGTLPTWYRDILSVDMLAALSREARVDLLLEVEVGPLAGWISTLETDRQAHILNDMPNALQASVRAAAAFPSRAHQLALAEQGRVDLAAGFQRQLLRAGIPFERVVCPPARGEA
jgi:hypothetical protein